MVRSSLAETTWRIGRVVGEGHAGDLGTVGLENLEPGFLLGRLDRHAHAFLDVVSILGIHVALGHEAFQALQFHDLVLLLDGLAAVAKDVLDDAMLAGQVVGTSS